MFSQGFQKKKKIFKMTAGSVFTTLIRDSGLLSPAACTNFSTGGSRSSSLLHSLLSRLALYRRPRRATFAHLYIDVRNGLPAHSLTLCRRCPLFGHWAYVSLFNLFYGGWTRPTGWPGDDCRGGPITSQLWVGCCFCCSRPYNNNTRCSTPSMPQSCRASHITSVPCHAHSPR